MIILKLFSGGVEQKLAKTCWYW